MANRKDQKSNANPGRTGTEPRSRRAPGGRRAKSGDEPLSLAEELVGEAATLADDTDERYEQIKQSGDTYIAYALPDTGTRSGRRGTATRR